MLRLLTTLPWQNRGQGNLLNLECGHYILFYNSTVLHNVSHLEPRPARSSAACRAINTQGCWCDPCLSGAWTLEGKRPHICSQMLAWFHLRGGSVFQAHLRRMPSTIPPASALVKRLDVHRPDCTCLADPFNSGPVHSILPHTTVMGSRFICSNGY